MNIFSIFSSVQVFSEGTLNMSGEINYKCIVIVLLIWTTYACGQNSSVSGEKCKYYQEKTKNYNLIPPGIVGGTVCYEGEFPHMAALGFGQDSNIQWQCGGTLISEQHILTAAHCTQHPNLETVKFIKLGDIYLDGSGEIIEVSRIINHPDYKPPSKYHDLAVLELSKPVNFTKNIRPACLYQYENLTEHTPFATGWGLTEFGGKPSNVLQKVGLSYFTNEECNEEYKRTSKRFLSKGIQGDMQICVGSRSKEMDTCQGDSGGPLTNLLVKHGLHFLVGITSFGKTCGTVNIPGVYTKVLHYIPWIENIVWP